MSDSNQVALSRMTRGSTGVLSKATRQAVPPFLQKLYEMVCDAQTDNLIRWSDGGDSFFVLDHERVAHDVLPRWFKHSNFASFVRQLNMYGFHKIPHLQQGVLKSDTETEIWNFEHPNFRRGQPDLLCLINRKKQASERQGEDAVVEKENAGLASPGCNAGSLMDINSIINGIQAIKRHQATISADLNELRSSNQALWQEALDARDRHQKQQDTINRILKFLAGVFGNSNTRKGSPGHGSPHPGIHRKRARLMIENHVDPLKEGSLEPLDDMDDVEVISAETTPHNQIVEVSPSPLPTATPSTTASEVPDVQTPPAYLPSQAPATADVLMGGNFSDRSPFAPHSNTSYDTSYIRPNDPNGTALTSTQSGPNQEILQSIANDPAMLQQLLNLLNLKQPPGSVPPGSELNSDTTSNTSTDFVDPLATYQQPPIPPVSASANVDLNPDPQTMSLLQNDFPIPLQPLISSEDKLKKTTKDAASISENLNAMESSIQSLISSIGFDPSQFSQLRNPDDSDSLPVYTNVATDPLLNNTNMDSSSFPYEEFTDFDFNTFLEKYAVSGTNNGELPTTTAEANINPVGSEFSEYTNANVLDKLMDSVNSHSPQPSAFVDEIASVTSQSDTSSSPTLPRATIIDENPFIPPPASAPPAPMTTTSSISIPNLTEAAKRTRKRKSDVSPAAIEINGDLGQTKSKRKK